MSDFVAITSDISIEFNRLS